MKGLRTESGFLANSVLIVSGLAGLLGLLGLLGWVTSIRRLSSLDIHYIPMAPDTAIALLVISSILLAISQLNMSRGQVRFCKVVSLILAIYGLLKALEYFVKADLTFSNLLLPVEEWIQGAPVKRMSPVAGALLFLSACATYLRLKPNWSARFKDVIGFLGALVFLSAIIPTIGYLFGTPMLYGTDIIPLAFPSAISFVLLGIALIIIAGGDTIILEPFVGSSVKSLLLKYFLPLAVFAVLFQGFLNEWLSRTFHYNHAMLSVSISLVFALVATIIVLRISHLIGSRIELAEEARRRNERTLQDRNEFIETILQNIHLGVAVHNTANNMSVYANPAFEKAYSIKKDDVSDLSSFFDKVYPDPVYRQQIIDMVMPGLMSGDPDKMKWDNIAVPKPSENARYITASNIPLPSQNLMISTVLDTTERNRAEEKLRASEERFRSIFENSTIGLYRTAPDSRTLLVNPAILKIMGFDTFEELNNRMAPNRGYVNAADAEEFLRRMSADGEVRGFESAWIRKDGSPVFVRESARAIFDSNGELMYYEGTVEDINDRKITENSLRDSEERFRAIFNNAMDGIFLRSNIDAQISNFSLVNQTACEMLGYSEAELLTKSVLQIETLTDPEEIARRIDLIISKDSLQFETTFRRSDGTIFPVDIKAHSFKLQDQDMILSIVRDISARRNLEDQLRQSQKMEAIGRLAGGVAHDFNNLLTVITGYCDLTTMALLDDDPLQLNINEINAAAERAVSLTRQLLAFSRKQALAPKIVDLNTTISDMEKMLKRMIGEDVVLHTIKAAELKKVKVDPSQIEQVIINIAINARDAMPDGGKLILETVNVELDEEYIATHPEAHMGQNVLLAITDTGQGMTNDVKSKIFDPFFTTKPLGKGTGLGLSTVFGIVKQSGGSINVYSEPDKGTVFKIYFPVADSQIVDKSYKVDYDNAKLRGTETILVVEDEDSVRQVAVRFLEAYGYQVYFASSGNEAIENYLVSTTKIDLLLTDVIMPNMRGNELAEVMRSQQPGLKVIFMSGYTANAIVHDGIIDPGTPYLAKPFSPIDLAKKVREILDMNIERGV